MTFDLHLGDCRDVMAEMEADSVDTIITDPPYGLEFMGKDWDRLGGEVVNNPESVGGFQDGNGGNPYSRSRIRFGEKATSMQSWHQSWAEAALRVAKPGAMLLAFGGARTHHRLMVAIEDAGWEIRDVVMWVYGSGFPKSHNIGKAIDKNGHTEAAATWDGYGTALKPAWEPVIVAMKPLAGTYAQNALEWGVAGLWIDGGRVSTNGETVSGPLDYINEHEGYQRPWKADKDEVGRRKQAAYDAANTKGRWPANLIHDGSDEVVREFPGNVKGGSHNRPDGWRGFNNNGKPTNAERLPGYTDTGSAARFFYCAKASRKERNAGEVDNKHPTVKPLALMRYLVRLTRTPTGGVVLDPFMGSGSTGCAAVLEGRDFIGIEQDAEYIEIARRRIEHWDKQPVQKELL